MKMKYGVTRQQSMALRIHEARLGTMRRIMSMSMASNAESGIRAAVLTSLPIIVELVGISNQAANAML